ncbi:phage tail tape measure protein, partial [Escherichia coli]|nr:phage tail tape measure protein [Escherichia coli]
KRSFNSTWNWIAEKLNRLPGISIDLKSTEPAGISAITPPGSPTVLPGNTPPQPVTVPPLAGERINAAIPQGGLKSQIRQGNTSIDNSRNYG